MRYRDLVLLIILVAVSSWALEANRPDEEAPPTPPSVRKSYFKESPPEPEKERPLPVDFSQAELPPIPTATLDLRGQYVGITLNYPEGEDWEPIGRAELLLGGRAFEVETLNKAGDQRWTFSTGDLNEEARAALESSDGAEMKVRLVVLDSHMKMSRAMRTFELESSPVAWNAR